VIVSSPGMTVTRSAKTSTGNLVKEPSSLRGRDLSKSVGNSIKAAVLEHDGNVEDNVRTTDYRDESKSCNSEFFDAFNVGLVVGGSITIPHLRRAVERLEECRKQPGIGLK